MMRLARTTIAFVIALSMAMLPAAGSAAVAKSHETAVSTETAISAEMSAAMHACCPDHAKPCDQGGNQCQSMASCAHQCFGISNVAVSQLTYPLVSVNVLPARTDQAVPLHAASPPFRPPRV